MRRYSSPYVSSYSFGPGPLSYAIKVLIGVNVAVFLLAAFDSSQFVERAFGLSPRAVVSGQVWQLATYMFLHVGPFHLLFNMLALWMFGTELERMWGTRYFLKFLAVTGIGAAVVTVLFSLLPLSASAALYNATVIGFSGAIYGLLLAFALYFPDRPLLLYFLFPIPAKYFVMILGALEFYSSFAVSGGVASTAHLGGLVIGYAYLKTGRVDPLAELKYRYLKWKINRVRRKFDVYSGGRADDWDRRVH
jgi:membrane associated rhomboid family serine protease